MGKSCVHPLSPRPCTAHPQPDTGRVPGLEHVFDVEQVRDGADPGNRNEGDGEPHVRVPREIGDEKGQEDAVQQQQRVPEATCGWGLNEARVRTATHSRMQRTATLPPPKKSAAQFRKGCWGTGGPEQRAIRRLPPTRGPLSGRGGGWVWGGGGGLGLGGEGGLGPGGGGRGAAKKGGGGQASYAAKKRGGGRLHTRKGSGPGGPPRVLGRNVQSTGQPFAHPQGGGGWYGVLVQSTRRAPRASLCGGGSPPRSMTRLGPRL